jgi:hypothetical protein
MAKAKAGSYFRSVTRGRSNRNAKPDGWRHFVTSLLAASLALPITGCDSLHNYPFTVSLWSVGGANRCTPAPVPAVKLYRELDDHDVLVTYDELREKDGRIRRRAFFFRANIDRLERGQKPHFVSTNAVMRLNLVAVAEIGATNAPVTDPITFRFSETAREFTIVWETQELGPYGLPDYVDAVARTKRVLLTPLVVTTDVVIAAVAVGTVVGIIGLWGWAGANSCRELN